jgi:hypothetical protein
MIYFLVNNNFHLIDAEKQLEELDDYPCGLIKIPHQLTLTPSEKFKLQFEFPKLISRLKDHFKFFHILSILKSIRIQLNNIQKDDVLIIYTEYEYLNHFVVKLFKQKNAKIILIEEGIPTYISFSSTPKPVEGIKKRLLIYYLKFILGIPKTTIVNINGLASTRMSDNQFDKVLLYSDLAIKRNIPVGLLQTKEFTFHNLNEKTVIYLNENIYDLHISMEKYLEILDNILLNLSKQFQKIYFKFHPREKEFGRNEAKKIIYNYPTVSIITDNAPVELMIQDIGAKTIVSFGAQTLLYLSNSNCRCIYIMHLFPELLKDKEINNMKTIVAKMDYVFISNWSDIQKTEVGFKNQTQVQRFSLKTHLKNLFNN